MSLSLSLKPICPATLDEPALNELIGLGLDLLNTIPSRTAAPPPSSDTQISWSAGKPDTEVKLWKATHKNEPWIARVSELADVGYDVLYRALVSDKSASEKAALMQPDDDVTPQGDERTFGDIKVTDVHKLLHVQAFSPREFLETIIHKDLLEEGEKEKEKKKGQEDGVEKMRSCIIISLPREGSIDNPSNSHGAYVSVEIIRELWNGKVEIILAVNSDAGGNIPRWVQNMAMAGQVLNDGKKFIKWMREQNQQQKSES